MVPPPPRGETLSFNEPSGFGLFRVVRSESGGIGAEFEVEERSETKLYDLRNTPLVKWHLPISNSNLTVTYDIEL